MRIKTGKFVEWQEGSSCQPLKPQQQEKKKKKKKKKAKGIWMRLRWRREKTVSAHENTSSQKRNSVMKLFCWGLTSHWYMTVAFDTFIMLIQCMLYKRREFTAHPFFFFFFFFKFCTSPKHLCSLNLELYRWVFYIVILDDSEVPSFGLWMAPETCSRTNLMNKVVSKNKAYIQLLQNCHSCCLVSLIGTTWEALNIRLLCHLSTNSWTFTLNRSK